MSLKYWPRYTPTLLCPKLGIGCVQNICCLSMTLWRFLAGSTFFSRYYCCISPTPSKIASKCFQLSLLVFHFCLAKNAFPITLLEAQHSRVSVSHSMCQVVSVKETLHAKIEKCCRVTTFKCDSFL